MAAPWSVNNISRTKDASSADHELDGMGRHEDGGYVVALSDPMLFPCCRASHLDWDDGA